MELYKSILAGILSKRNVHVVFPGLRMNAEEIVDSACYQALAQIKSILEDDGLDDSACFNKVEAIICLFEEMGVSVNRHDFG